MTGHPKDTILIISEKLQDKKLLGEFFSGEFGLLYSDVSQEALAAISENYKAICLILIDAGLKGEGLQLLYKISQSEYGDKPIIVISNDKRYQFTALTNGAWDFISRPLEPQFIKASVKNVLGHKAFTVEKQLSQEMKINFDKLQEEYASLTDFINEMPMGVAVFKLSQPMELYYFSKGLASLCKATPEEFAKQTKIDPLYFIEAGERAGLIKNIYAGVTTKGQIDENLICVCENSKGFMVRLTGKYIKNKDGELFFHGIFTANSKLMQLYDSLVNSTPHIIYVSDINTYDMLYLNKVGEQTYNLPDGSYKGKKCYDALYGLDHPCPFCKIGKMNYDEFLERDSYNPRLNKTFHLRGKLIVWNGFLSHVEYIEDVTNTRRIEKQNADLTKQLSQLIDNIPGAMGLYRFDGSTVSMVTNNQAYFTLMGYSPENAKRVQKGENELNLHPDDMK